MDTTSFDFCVGKCKTFLFSGKFHTIFACHNGLTADIASRSYRLESLHGLTTIVTTAEM